MGKWCGQMVPGDANARPVAFLQEKLAAKNTTALKEESHTLRSAAHHLTNSAFPAFLVILTRGTLLSFGPRCACAKRRRVAPFAESRREREFGKGTGQSLTEHALYRKSLAYRWRRRVSSILASVSAAGHKFLDCSRAQI